MFETAEMTLPCRACGQERKQTLAWIKANDHFVCACGVRTDLERSQLLAGLEQVEDRLAKFKGDIAKRFRR